MEKIDWTKPIEDMDGKPCSVVEIDKKSQHFPAQVMFPNGRALWVDAYGRWNSYQVRNVAEATDVELAVNSDEGSATLRDQFAMAALAAAYRNDVPPDMARWVYDIADAMLEARNK